MIFRFRILNFGLKNSNSQFIAIILLIHCSFVFSSCKFFNKKDIEKDEKPIARVLQKNLYASDLYGLVRTGTSSKDSLEIVNNFIDNWIRKNLVIHTAENNLTEEQKNIEKQKNDYRESLLIYLYEKALVGQKLDTVVNENEIQEYYQNYKSNFALKNNLVRVKFVIAKKESAATDSIKYWLKSPGNGRFHAKLNDFCSRFAVNYSISNDAWFSMDDLNKQIPFRNDNQENFLKYLWTDKDGNRIVELKDTAKLYIANILEYKLKGEPSPLLYIREDIQKIIVNKRKISLIKRTYDEIYQDGLRKGKFEIYR